MGKRFDLIVQDGIFVDTAIVELDEDDLKKIIETGGKILDACQELEGVTEVHTDVNYGFKILDRGREEVNIDDIGDHEVSIMYAPNIYTTRIYFVIKTEAGPEAWAQIGVYSKMDFDAYGF